MNVPTLKEKLVKWTDRDVADIYLAQCLGLMSLDVDWGKAKSIFWTNNPISSSLDGFLDKLAEVGVLEKRDEPDQQFRWNATYKGRWE